MGRVGGNFGGGVFFFLGEMFGFLRKVIGFVVYVGRC